MWSRGPDGVWVRQDDKLGAQRTSGRSTWEVWHFPEGVRQVGRIGRRYPCSRLIGQYFETLQAAIDAAQVPA